MNGKTQIFVPRDLAGLMRPVGSVRPNPANPRTHSRKQIRALAKAIREIGFMSPIVVDSEGMILAGHGRHEAAALLGMTDIPVVVASELNQAQKRAYVLADNQLATLAGWDRGLLAAELGFLGEAVETLGLGIADLGFSPGEINQILADRGPQKGDPADHVPSDAGSIVSRPGTHWRLGQLGHEIICGDARDTHVLERLLDGRKADMGFVDKPYNVAVNGHIGGRGKIRHAEFAMASGEMDRDAFREFSRSTDQVLRSSLRDGALLYSCIDWRSVDLFIEVARDVFGEDALLNLVVWNKTNAGQGSLYRSQHELILVLKNGNAPHCNGVELGRHGRSRSNVWTYPGANTFRKGRMTDLAGHPTPKPVQLVADAMLDCTLPGQSVVDTFLGSGTTLLAAEKVGRRCFGVELEPRYIDLSIRRWQAFTGIDAVCASSGRSFDEIAEKATSELSQEGIRDLARDAVSLCDDLASD